jgi:hypothetical protein
MGDDALIPQGFSQSQTSASEGGDRITIDFELLCGRGISRLCHRGGRFVVPRQRADDRSVLLRLFLFAAAFGRQKTKAL